MLQQREHKIAMLIKPGRLPDERNDPIRLCEMKKLLDLLVIQPISQSAER